MFIAGHKTRYIHRIVPRIAILSVKGSECRAGPSCSIISVRPSECIDLLSWSLHWIIQVAVSQLFVADIGGERGSSFRWKIDELNWIYWIEFIEGVERRHGEWQSHSHSSWSVQFHWGETTRRRRLSKSRFFCPVCGISCWRRVEQTDP